MTLRNAHVDISAGGAAVKPRTSRKLTFSGAESVTLAPGSSVRSDGVATTLKGRRLRGVRVTARSEGNEAVAAARREFRIR